MQFGKRRLSENRALKLLEEVREEFRATIRDRYEIRAKSCVECDSPGACCRDAHFVNIRISRLEAVAIRNALEPLDEDHRATVYQRIGEAIERFGLDRDGDETTKTFACPLYERHAGCLVHNMAKPLPCIYHACYENKEDLPPDELLEKAELAVERLNQRVYGRQQTLLPLPVAIRNTRVS